MTQPLQGKAYCQSRGYQLVKIFSGPDARRQARAYAEQRYGQFEEIRLEPYRH